MPPWLAEMLLSLVAGYAWAGLAVGCAFLLFGLDRVDPLARGAYAFRPLLLPGLALLWPLVLWRWAGLRRPAPPRGPARAAQRRRHLLAWGTLAVVLPAIGIAAAALRAGRPDAPPERLGPAPR